MPSDPSIEVDKTYKFVNEFMTVLIILENNTKTKQRWSRCPNIKMKNNYEVSTYAFYIVYSWKFCEIIIDNNNNNQRPIN